MKVPFNESVMLLINFITLNPLNADLG